MNTPNRKLLIVVNDQVSFLARRFELARIASQRGYDVHVAFPAPEPGDANDQSALEAVPLSMAEAEAAGVFTLHRIRMRRGARAFKDELHTLVELRRIIRQVRPDVLHQFAIKPSLYGLIASTGLRPLPRVINSFIGLGYLFSRRDLIGAMMRLGYCAAYGLAARGHRVLSVFQNEENADVMRVGARLRADSIRVTSGGSGVDLAKFSFSPIPAGQPIVLLPGRMLWDKGIGEFVTAARVLRRRGILARFVLAGALDRENPAAIPQAQLSRWADEGVVEWWGLRSDMPSVYSEATLVCLPSYGEGVPRSLLEASAVGRAIVATDVAGCRDVVSHGTTGFLVPPKNPGALADTLECALADTPRLANMGRNGRARAEAEFGLTAVVERALTLYEELFAE